MKHLIVERNTLLQECRAVLDKAEKEGRALTAEDKAEISRREARMKDLAESIEVAGRVAEEERALGESLGRKTETRVSTGDAPSAEDQRLALQAWALGRRATPAMLEAAQRVGMRAADPEMEITTRITRGADGRPEYRALSIGTTTAGGNSVANELMRAYYEVQKWYGSVRSVADSVRTDTGATLPWPSVTDTSNTGEIIGESTAATTTADPTFAVVNLGAYKFSSKAVIVSVELLQDSSIDLASYLGTALGRRIGRIQNTKFTVGAGTTEPNGLVVASAAGATSGATNAFTLDDIITLIHSVDMAYRNQPGAGLMMHDTVAAYVRKLKDGQGRYQWEPSTQIGQPDRLFGYPVAINNDMSATFTTGQKLTLFGMYNPAYLVRDAGGVTMIRDESVRVLNHDIVFLAFQRSDGNLVDSTAVKHMKLA